MMSEPPLRTGILAFEQRYEEKSQDFAELSRHWPEPSWKFLAAVLQANWTLVEKLGDQALLSAEGSAEKAFLLQWIIAGCEIRGDMDRRLQRLDLWRKIPSWAGDPYCRYLRTYHEGVTHFSDGNLREADIRFGKALEQARAMNYPRGEVRGLFHLALVRRDLEDFDGCLALFNDAFDLAKASGFRRWMERIENIRGRYAESTLAPSILERAQRDIEKLISDNRVDDARSRLLEAETLRRSLKLKRRARSFYAFLPAIAAARGKNGLSERLLHRITDPILRIQAFDFKRRSIGLSEVETHEWNYLREVHGLSQIVQRSSVHPLRTEICGTPLSQIQDQELRQLMELLLQAKTPVSKEQICRNLWKLNYDPTIHDSRIYKLIHRARVTFKSHGMIKNTYGGYILNAG